MPVDCGNEAIWVAQARAMANYQRSGPAQKTAARVSQIDLDPPTSMIACAVGNENNARRRLDQAESRFSGMLSIRHLLTIGGECREEGRMDDPGLNDDIPQPQRLSP
jgi:hypothetical protein